MYSIIVTAFLLASDAFFIGMSLGFQKKFKYRYLFLINGIIIAISFIVYLTTSATKDFIEIDTSLIVGTIFLIMGIKNVLSKNDDKKQSMNIKSLIALGLIMSIDASIGTASLTIGNEQTILIPIFVSATHLIYTYIGSCVGKCLQFSRNSRIGYIISGLSLMIVGILNIISF